MSTAKQALFFLFVGICALIAFIPPLTYFYFANDLGSKERIMNRKDTGVVLLDRNDTPFFTFYAAKQKTLIPLPEMPEVVGEAVIAAEDKDFYRHQGFSVKAIVGALIADIRNKGFRYGGSTITQQLVKNALLKPTKSFMRKYQEIVLASEIERRFTKDEILEMYLNSVYFGEGAFGIEEAAQVYFGKSAKDLTLGEASLLAALLPAPSTFSPISGDEQKAKERQRAVLEEMAEQDYISLEEKTNAEEEPLNFGGVTIVNTRAPHFALMVRKELIERFGQEHISRSGFKVKTTLDLTWQVFTERTVSDQVARLGRNQVSNGAAVVLDPTSGEIRALVGSKDWQDDVFGKFNIATAARPPGSAFKPIVYSAAFEQKLITPATILSDEPIVYHTVVGDYAPKNFDRKFRGKVTARRALANSLNVPSVAVLSKLGIPKTLAMAKRLGITTLKDESQYGLSLVLGPADIALLELTVAYGTFANGGQYHAPVTILSIEDKHGNVLYTHAANPTRVVDQEVAFLISSILADNQARAEALGNALTISRPAAVKTGTTEDFKDAWTIGYTPSLAVGVWVGNNDNQPMDRIAGSLGAAPIWRALMEKFLADTPVEQFVPPDGIVSMTICSSGGTIATGSAVPEFFIKATASSKPCVPTPTSPPASIPTILPTEPISPQPTQGNNNNKKEGKDKPAD